MCLVACSLFGIIAQVGVVVKGDRTNYLITILGSPWLRIVFVIFEIGISSLSTITNDIFEVSPNSPPN